MTDLCFSSCVCLFLCVCFAEQHRQSLRQRHRWLCDAHNSNKPKKTHRNLTNAGEGGREGKGIYLPGNSFI